jgi:E3 ubiquitin-protein ligase RNF14
VVKYMGLEEGSEGRAVLQRRFGKGNLERLVRQYEEDRANREWLDKSTVACPGCGVHTEKSAGCNHVCHFFRLRRDRLVIYGLTR